MLQRQPDRTMRRLLAAGLTLICVGTGCATVDTAVVANPGAAFSLPLGKTATVSGTGFRITFNRVTEDSRCPVDVTCVWAGDAKIELIVSRTTASADYRIVSLTPPNNESTAGDLKVRFVSLAPAPRQSEPGPSRAYIAQLVVLSP